MGRYWKSQKLNAKGHEPKVNKQGTNIINFVKINLFGLILNFINNNLRIKSKHTKQKN